MFNGSILTVRLIDMQIAYGYSTVLYACAPLVARPVAISYTDQAKSLAMVASRSICAAPAISRRVSGVCAVPTDWAS